MMGRVSGARPGIRSLAVVLGMVAGSPAFSPQPAVASPAPAVSIEAVCPAASPGTARCLALRRTDVAPRPASAVSLLAPPPGYGPADLQSAYALPSSTAGSGMTVAVVDAFDLPTAESDLAAYRSAFGLPACTTANGCFQKVDQNGGTNYPKSDPGWGQEIALDIDMVSAICPNCHILLVEANDAQFADLGTAVNTAVSMGAVAVSNSYGGPEWIGETLYDSYYDHPGVAITVSTGDCGFQCQPNGNSFDWVVGYPAASPDVIAVGGTKLVPDSSARGWSESAWGDATEPGGAGSGCSLYEPKPSWQHDTNCSMRMEADVSAVADPKTAVAVYVSGGWTMFGGTSASAPIIAATYALAGGPASGTYPAGYLYSHAAALNDVVGGNNNIFGQTCSPTYFCNGVAGYDGPTGLGTPNGLGAFGVAGPATHLSVSGLPSPTVAGAAHNLTVTALDADGYTATGYLGTVHFTSSDPAAALPADYTFTAADAGRHTFSVTLKTVGTRTVTATDKTTASITGTQSAIVVNPGSASRLVLSGLPSPYSGGVPRTLTVKALDPYGNIARGYRGAVHFTSTDPYALLPADYTFTAADNGTHAFSLTLKNYGTQSVTATDKANASIKGTQGSISVIYAASTYHAIGPRRVLDTRPTVASGNPTNIGLSGPFVAGVVRAFKVAGARYVGGGTAPAIPANATAVTGNLTIVGETAPGVVAVGPTTTATGAVTTINFVKGDTRANNVTIGLSGAGYLAAVYRSSTAGATTNVIFDVTGYFTPDTGGATYHPLTPGRILDTRPTGSGHTNIGLKGKFLNRVVRTINVVGAAGLGWPSAQVPLGAVAVTGNLTVTNATSVGYVALGPTMTSQPSTSTLNVPAGTNIANGVTVALSSGRLQAVWCGTIGSSADVILDISGYFTQNATGLSYHPLNPVRLVDSSKNLGLSGSFASRIARTFVVGGLGGVPADARAISGNLTVLTPSSDGWALISPEIVASPTTSTVNVRTGRDVANGFNVPLGTGGHVALVWAGATSSTANIALDVTGYWK